MAKKPTKAQVDAEKALAKKQEAYELNVLEVGMSPYNAAIVAGFTPTDALKKSAEDMAKQVFGGRDFKDLAERKKITPMKIIEYLAMRAGFFDREDGAKKVVSLVPALKKMGIAKGKGTNAQDRLANPDDANLPAARELEWDWVEVPDDGIQQKYMAMLLDFLQYTGQAKAGATVPIGSGSRSFSVHFHVKEDEGKQIAKHTLALGVEHLNGNGNGAHFTVVDPKGDDE